MTAIYSIHSIYPISDDSLALAEKFQVKVEKSRESREKVEKK